MEPHQDTCKVCMDQSGLPEPTQSSHLLGRGHLKESKILPRSLQEVPFLSGKGFPASTLILQRLAGGSCRANGILVALALLELVDGGYTMAVGRSSQGEWQPPGRVSIH